VTLYVDSSALIKRHVAEADSDHADAILLCDPDWVTGRHTYVEVSLAIPHAGAGACTRSSQVFAS
jgi:predicted nucleic acid-binding protein